MQITLKIVHPSSASILTSYIFTNTFDIILDDKKAYQTHQVHNQTWWVFGTLLGSSFSSPALPLLLGILLPPSPCEWVQWVFEKPQPPKGESPSPYHLIE